MEKYFKFAVYLFSLTMLALPFTSCSDDDDPVIDPEDKEAALKPIVENYVNNIVIVTYKNLADASSGLYDKLKALKADKTDANVKAAAEAWKISREHWELSEAFLFGPVDDFGVDPHIDTWPLDVEGFKRLMNNKSILEQLEKEDGELGSIIKDSDESLLGFHGIEYILFKDGEPKSASEITADEMIYAVAVGNDLRNHCIILEASWAGKDNVSEAKRKLIESNGLTVVEEDSNRPYGELMFNPEGTVFKSVVNAASHILEYAFVIADEVGNVKIGRAANEVADDEDRNYIESPYSHNSLKDFKDNIIGIENAYLGKAYGKEGQSISSYIAGLDADADEAVKAAIEASYKALDAIPAPFSRNYTSAEADKAVEVIGETLAKALTRAKTVLFEN